MDTIKQVEALSREQVIEAASTLSNIITGGKEDENAVMLAKQIEKNPTEHIEEIEELSRLILINAAETDEYKDLVQQAIESAGQKQFILGGAEIIALAVIGVAALKIILNPVKNKITKIKNKDGSVKETREEHDSDTGFLSSVFGWLGK